MKTAALVLALLTPLGALARPRGTFAIDPPSKASKGELELLWSRVLLTFDGDRIKETMQMLQGNRAVAIACEVSAEVVPVWTADGYRIEHPVDATAFAATVEEDRLPSDSSCSMNIPKASFVVEERKDGAIVLHGTDDSGAKADIVLRPADPAPHWSERLKAARRH